MPILKPFVALDLAAAVVLGRPAVQRCLDTAWRASDGGSECSDSALRDLYGALDRVLVAHVMCDPFVHEREGMSALLRALQRLDIPAIGVATFAPAVSLAIAERLRWPRLGLNLDGLVAMRDGPLWKDISRAALRAGHRIDDVAFVSDDTWELAVAAKSGCGLPIYVGAEVMDAVPGIATCVTFDGVLGILRRKLLKLPIADLERSSHSNDAA